MGEKLSKKNIVKRSDARKMENVVFFIQNKIQILHIISNQLFGPQQLHLSYRFSVFVGFIINLYKFYFPINMNNISSNRSNRFYLQN